MTLKDPRFWIVYGTAVVAGMALCVSAAAVTLLAIATARSQCHAASMAYEDDYRRRDIPWIDLRNSRSSLLTGKCVVTMHDDRDGSVLNFELYSERIIR